MTSPVSWDIYLDVDGVCADFITPALALVGLEPTTIMARWASDHAGEFYPESLLGIPRETFFQEIDRHGAAFWRELPAYAWFPDLYQALSRHGQVLFLTAPTGFPDCLAGKYQWLCDQFGTGFDECVFTHHKDRLAHANAILIDDSDLNIRQFQARGGQGVVFPQLWNSAGNQLDPMASVLAQVTTIVQGKADLRARSG